MKTIVIHTELYKFGLLLRTVDGLFLSISNVATIEYSSESLCASICVCVFPCFCTITKKNRSRNMKFKYVVRYENNSDKFDIGHCRTKFKVMTQL